MSVKQKAQKNLTNAVSVMDREGSDSISLQAFGVVPVGGILTWMGGYFAPGGTNTGFVAVLHNTDLIAAVNRYLNPLGFYVCNGAAPVASGSPIWNAAGRYLPNLTDERFLRGSSSIGTATGGSNTMRDHVHTHALITSAGAAHSHTWGNNWSINFPSLVGTSATPGSSNGDGSQNVCSDGISGVYSWNTGISAVTVGGNSINHAHYQAEVANFYMGGYPIVEVDGRWSCAAVNINGQWGSAYATGAATYGMNVNSNHNHFYTMPTHRHWLQGRSTTVSVQPGSVATAQAHTHTTTGSIGGASAPGSTENRPKYMKCFMIIRVE